MSSYAQRALLRAQKQDWVVCYTEPRGERRAADGMTGAGTVCFLPMEKFRGKPGKPPVERPLFPRYLFTKIDDGDEWGRLMKIDGVLDVLRNNNTPMRIPEFQISGLRKAEECGLFDHTTINPNGFAIGEQVRVAEGPFTGFNAEIREFIGKIRSATAIKRARILVNFMGRMTGVEMPVTALEKL